MRKLESPEAEDDIYADGQIGKTDRKTKTETESKTMSAPFAVRYLS